MATRTLQLSSQLSIPRDAVTETFALLASRGAGKSNAARVLAEEMFAAHLPFVAIDPVGSWWGLRSSRDGKGDGLPIPIFGGRHGDMPLEEGSGTFVADLIIERNLTCVLDLSRFPSEKAKKRFLLDFLRRLYTENQTPRHIFFEEADDYIPQKPIDNDDNYLLRASENIVRRGRGRGLGITLITQRSAVLNKNVLEQVQTLFAMRVTGPNDRDAIERWVKFHGERKEIVSTLAELKDGEVWLYSPEYLKTVKRFRFRLTKTFDSGRTPKMEDAKQPPATLREIDLGKLRKSMADTIERVEQEDPKRLRTKIAELQRELARKQPAAPKELPAIAVEREVAKRLVPIKRAARHRATMLSAIAKQLQKLIQDGQAAMVGLRSIVDSELRESGEEPAPMFTATVHAAAALKHRFAPVPRDVPHASEAVRESRPRPAGRVLADASAALSNGDGVKLSKPQQDMLNGLAWSESIHIDQLGQGHLALLTKQMPSARGFQANLSKLVGAGLAERLGKDVRLTTDGRERATSFESPTSLASYHDALCEFLSTPQSRMLRTLLAESAHSLTHEQLAARTEQDPDSRGYQANVSKLVGLNLVHRESPTSLGLTDMLFPPGLV